MSELDQSNRDGNVAWRRQSHWNLLLVVFGVHAIGAAWWGLFQLNLFAQSVLAPQKRFGQNMSNLGEIFLTLPPLFPALAIGMLAANLRVWLIPPARHALEREARSQQRSEFAPAMKELAIATAVLLGLALPLSLLGAVDFFQ
jgi:hypothetical protein